MNLKSPQITVKDLLRYPVKSAKEEALDEAKILFTGIEKDRTWMIVNDKGSALTQRKKPLMANIVVNCNWLNLEIIIPGKDVCLIEEPLYKNWCKVEIWGDICDALTIDHVVNEYLSDYLQIKCKLVVLSNERQRTITDTAAKGVVTFADAFPFLIIGTASLQELNEKLHKDVSMKNFRPNIVVNTTVAHEEDLWDEIQIGEVVFKNVKLCSRCILTTVDPDTGIFSKDQEPLQTLITYRKIDKKIMFGSNLVAMNEGYIKKADKVVVLSYKNNITNY